MTVIALVVIVLLGISSLGIDAFRLYWAKSNLQQACDAGALAGASYLSNASFSGGNAACQYATVAQRAACTYAMANGVQISEIESIAIGADSRSVTVTIARNVPATFARVLGYTQFTVRATATAGLQSIGSTNNVMPVGLNGSTPYHYGQPILMHAGSCGSGCWGAVDYAGSGSSGSVFRQQLASGCACNVSVGSSYNSNPGAKVGDARPGMSDRISAGNTADPSGTWQSHQIDNVRAAAVGLVSWGTGSGSVQTATVTGFAEVWVTDSSQPDFPAACQGMANSDICAIFIRQIVPQGSGSSTTDTGAMRAVLLQ